MFARWGAVGVLLLLQLSSLTVHARLTSPTIVCIAGQCIQGYSNTTLGATLTSGSTSLHLLPGLYTSTTNPQLLHDTLTSSSASLSPLPGFSDLSTSNTGTTTVTRLFLPLSISLQPGLALYVDKLYAGQVALVALPTVPSPQTPNNSITITAGAVLLSPSVFASLIIGTANNNNNTNRVIIWDSVPDISQLPRRLAQSALSLLDVQSTSCSTLNGGCSSAGVCTPSTSTSTSISTSGTTTTGQCQCRPNFTGPSCESCAAGCFGLSCTPCVTTGCAKCDDGINGSGRCLESALGAGDPRGCNCASGVCGSDGVSCTCTNGFETAAGGGQQCSTCKAGFFKDADGGCKVCELGCSSCADLTGECTSCQPRFTKNPKDSTKCDPPQGVTTNSRLCPDGSFPNGATCAVCPSECETCTGSSGCVRCKAGLYTLNGACVSANSAGICAGTDLVADNSKRECDSCDAKCLKCEIPNFTIASIASLAQCTQCLPGSFLSNGKCVDACPSGTTSNDNSVCVPCDSSCATCAGSPTFCLTCPNNQLAFNGKCLPSCPTNAFTSSSSAGQCLSCHPDCASCSGAAFKQCTSCPSTRPVLTSSGRCVSACEAKNQFFDPTLTPGVCRQCDASCSTCSGPSSSECLSCSGENTLVGGSCSPATCESGTNVVSGLGLCLAPDLVSTKSPNGDGGGGALLPPVGGIDTTTVVEKKKGLEWWQILLMVLGCLFIFCFVAWCFCHRKKRKAKEQRQIMVMGNIGKGDGHGEGMPKSKKRSWSWHALDWFQSLFGFGHIAKRRRQRKRMMEKTYEPYGYAHAPAYFIPTYVDRMASHSHSRSQSQTHSYSNSNSNLNSMRKISISPPPKKPTPLPPPPPPPATTETGKMNWIWSMFGHSPPHSPPPIGRKIVHLGPLNTSEQDFNNNNNNNNSNNEYYENVNAELEKEKAEEIARDKAKEEPKEEKEYDSEAVIPMVSMPLPTSSVHETVDMIHLIESYNRPLAQRIPLMPTNKNAVPTPWRSASPLPAPAPASSGSGSSSGRGSRKDRYARETHLRPGARAPPPSVPASIFASSDEDDDVEYYGNYDHHALDKRSSLLSDAYANTDYIPPSASHEHYIPAPLPSPSIYSQFTARPNPNARNHGGSGSGRRLPEPRVPLTKDVGRRFDASEFGRGSMTRPRVADPF